MRDILFLVTVFLSISSSNITAGQKIIVVGGSGNGLYANDANGGMYEAPSTWKTFQGDSGAPVVTLEEGAVVNFNGNVRLKVNSDISAVISGTYAYCEFSDSYSNNRYCITAVNKTEKCIDLRLPFVSSATINKLVVGGALKSIKKGQSVLYEGAILKISGGPYGEISSNKSIIDCSVFPVLPGRTMSADDFGKWVVIEGVSAFTGEVDANNKVVLDCKKALADYGTIMSSCYTFRGFTILDAAIAGCSGTKANYTILSDLEIKNSGIGVQLGDFSSVNKLACYNCKNGGVVLGNQGKLISSALIDNSGKSAVIANGVILNSVVNSKSIDTLVYFKSYPSLVHSTTIKGGNGATGIFCGRQENGTIPKISVFNSIISGCSVGIVGIESYSPLSSLNNNCIESGISKELQDIRSAYGNIKTSPEFENATNGNLMLKSNSPLRTIGFDAWSALADTSFATIGGVAGESKE